MTRTLRARALAAIALTFAATACLPTPAPPVRQAEDPPPPFGIEDPAELLPTAGLRWAVLARPRTIFDDPELSLELTKTITPARMKRLQQTYGVGSPAGLRQLAYVSYGATTLVVVATPIQPSSVERSVAAISEIEGRAVDRQIDPRGRITRFWGTVGKERQQWALLGHEAVAVESGRFGPLRAVEAFAAGRLKKARPVASLDEIKVARRAMPSPDLMAIIRPPLEAPWDELGGGVLRSARFVTVTAKLRDGGPGPERALAVRAHVFGDWGDRRVEAQERLGAVWDALAASRLGRLFGLDRPLAPFSARGDEEMLAFEVTVDATRIARGLHWATGASTAEIFAPSDIH